MYILFKSSQNCPPNAKAINVPDVWSNLSSAIVKTLVGEGDLIS